MTLAYGHIAQRMFNTPLAYDARKAEAFVAGLGGRVSGGEIIVVNGGNSVDHTAFENGRPAAGRLGNRLGRAYQRYGEVPFPVIDNAAIIAIEGTLVHKGGYVGQSSGVTSYEGLMTQLIAAKTATQQGLIKGVIFEVDSYGGEVDGLFETVSLAADLSRIIPTVAILTNYAYSAAYALASQARSIIAPEFGGAGSIGVIMMHLDVSQAYEDAGFKVTIIRSGARKAEGNPFEPLPQNLVDEWQAESDVMREKFAGIVAKGRRGAITAAKAMKTEAKAFSSTEALSLGLIDAIADPSAAFDAFIKDINRS